MVFRRRTALLAGLSLAACARRSSTGELRPVTAEGGSRRLLVIELTRQAQVSGLERTIEVSACQWHVSAEGALFGDHWGWCEDFRILPKASPGYLLLTTNFTGDMNGGFGKLVVLQPLPASVEAFGRPLQIADAGGRLLIEFGGLGGELKVRQPLPLGGEHTLVESPIDTGHFEPGFDTPVPADVTYAAVSYGMLESRRISGRSD
jgi:hypothetical protein